MLHVLMYGGFVYCLIHIYICLRRWLGFRRAPFVVRRVLHLQTEILPVATDVLRHTFFYDGSSLSSFLASLTFSFLTFSFLASYSSALTFGKNSLPCLALFKYILRRANILLPVTAISSTGFPTLDNLFLHITFKIYSFCGTRFPLRNFVSRTPIILNIENLFHNDYLHSY